MAADSMTIAGIASYKNMGVHWTLTILGAISALMAPVPYVYFINMASGFGARVNMPLTLVEIGE